MQFLWLSVCVYARALTRHKNQNQLACLYLQKYHSTDIYDAADQTFLPDRPASRKEKYQSESRARELTSREIHN